MPTDSPTISTSGTMSTLVDTLFLPTNDGTAKDDSAHSSPIRIDTPQGGILPGAMFSVLINPLLTLPEERVNEDADMNKDDVDALNALGITLTTESIEDITMFDVLEDATPEAPTNNIPNISAGNSDAVMTDGGTVEDDPDDVVLDQTDSSAEVENMVAGSPDTSREEAAAIRHYYSLILPLDGSGSSDDVSYGSDSS